ncbi:MAG: aldo/keto reductase [Anaerolineae bacterium]|nr:aldo/keto reductase [Anaerolineae bacterium]
MDYINLGRSGLQVSRLCLGTMTFGRETDEPTSRIMLDRFVEVGGTFIDTANAYSSGHSEEIIGNWLTDKPRHDLIIGTRTMQQLEDNLGAVGWSLNADQMRRLNDASRKRTPYPYQLLDDLVSA